MSIKDHISLFFLVEISEISKWPPHFGWSFLLIYFLNNASWPFKWFSITIDIIFSDYLHGWDRFLPHIGAKRIMFKVELVWNFWIWPPIFWMILSAHECNQLAMQWLLMRRNMIWVVYPIWAKRIIISLIDQLKSRKIQLIITWSHVKFRKWLLHSGWSFLLIFTIKHHLAIQMVFNANKYYLQHISACKR